MASVVPDKYSQFACAPGDFSKFVVFPAEPVRRSPIIFSGNGAPWYRELNERSLKGSVGPLGIYRFLEATVSVQGRLVNQEKSFIYAADLFDEYSMDRFSELDWRKLQREAEAALQAPPNMLAFLICKPGHRVYGHWLVDLLPQVWLARVAAAKLYPEMADCPFLVESGTPSWARTMMIEGLGVPDHLILEYDEDLSPVRYRHILVPSLLRRESAMSAHIGDFAQFVRMHLGIDSGAIAKSSLPRRFYNLRRAGRSRPAGSQDREIHEEEKFIQICEQHGITAIDPGTLSWRDKVLLFSAAEFVVGPFGSGMHNLIFSQPGTRTLIMANRYMNWLQSSIAAIGQHRLAYLFEEEEISTEGNLLFRYDIELFKKLMTAV